MSASEAPPPSANEHARELIPQRGRHITGHRVKPTPAIGELLAGVVLAMREDSGGVTVLSRIGPGQCVGELGVLEDAPRSASVVAETDVTVLRIDAARFRAWVRDNPALTDYLGTLSWVYPFADGRMLSVYRSMKEGQEAISTVLGDPSGDCILSTKTVGQDVVALAKGTSGLAGQRSSVSFASEKRKRVLLLKQVAEPGEGVVTGGGCIVGVEARGLGPDLPILYERMRSGRPLSSREITRFRRVGHLGGQGGAQDPQRVCLCLGIRWKEVEAVRSQCGDDPAAIVSTLGIGAVCGTCIPGFEASMGAGPGPCTDTSDSSRLASGAPKAVVKPGLVPRLPDIEFDKVALEELAAEPEAHLVVVASIFATVGERFMVRHVSDALPHLHDRDLIADAEAFLIQERNHIEAHGELNRLYLEEVYPDSVALKRLAAGMMPWIERLPHRVALALCAAFEHIADSTFELYFTRYYADGRVFSADPQLHALIERSGAGRLMHWHGCEELSHRHVAFDVMRARGGGLLTRWLGFGVLVLQLSWSLFPALASLRLVGLGKRRPQHPTAEGAGSLVFRAVIGAARFLHPRFHPASQLYPFMNELSEEQDQYPRANPFYPIGWPQR